MSLFLFFVQPDAHGVSTSMWPIHVLPSSWPYMWWAANRKGNCFIQFARFIIHVSSYRWYVKQNKTKKLFLNPGLGLVIHRGEITICVNICVLYTEKKWFFLSISSVSPPDEIGAVLLMTHYFGQPDSLLGRLRCRWSDEDLFLL